MSIEPTDSDSDAGSPYNMEELGSDGQDEFDLPFPNRKARLEDVSDQRTDSRRQRGGKSKRDRDITSLEDISRLLSNDDFVEKYTMLAKKSELTRVDRELQYLQAVLNDVQMIESDTEIPKYVSQNTFSDTKLEEYITQNAVQEEQLEEGVYQQVEELLQEPRSIEQNTSISSYLLEKYGLDEDSIGSINDRLSNIEQIKDNIDKIYKYYNKSLQIRDRKFYLESLSMVILGVGIIASTVGLYDSGFLSSVTSIMRVGILGIGLIGFSFILTGVLGLSKLQTDD